MQQTRLLNGRWVVEGHCCCWRGCCWRENRNFGWNWEVEGGVDGGDGEGWWILMRGPDRPSETASPDEGGEALEPGQILILSLDLYDKQNHETKTVLAFK